LPVMEGEDAKLVVPAEGDDEDYEQIYGQKQTRFVFVHSISITTSYKARKVPQVPAISKRAEMKEANSTYMTKMMTR